MRKLVLIFLLLVPGLARAADVDTPPASCFANPGRWTYDRTKEAGAVVGQRFLDDMQACDASFAANVVDAVRFQIQKDETDKFLHQRTFFLGAYGLCWAILAVAGLALWLRQRRLVRELVELEARLKAAGAGSPS